MNPTPRASFPEQIVQLPATAPGSPRSARKRLPVVSVSSRRLVRLQQAQNELDEVEIYDRPKTRRDCLSAEQAEKIMGFKDKRGDGLNCQRPCPFVSCRYHLYVGYVGRPHIGEPGYPEPWEIPVTCTLDIADEQGKTLEEVGTVLDLTRERIRQIESEAMVKFKTQMEELGYDIGDAISDRDEDDV